MKNYFFENLNHLIVKKFWMVKIWTYFHKSIWVKKFDSIITSKWEKKKKKKKKGLNT
jgi:hypothetical protein